MPVGRRAPGNHENGRMWRGRLARGRGSVPLPRAGRMPARQRAGCPRHDFQSSADSRPSESLRYVRCRKP